MVVKKRNECFNTLEDVVLGNVDNVNDIYNLNREYRIDHLTDAAELIKQLGGNGETITIVGDYDADGVCATSILSLVFEKLGYNFRTRLPKRFSEGYGLSEKIVNEIDDGLLLTVDNGITAFDAIEFAKAKGLTVIVTDHHLLDETKRVPNADIVINPNALPETGDFNGYCGAGLAYRLAIELLGKEDDLIPKLLSFATIATIADVMPLIAENRKIVKEGLKVMLTEKGQTDGLRELLNVNDFLCYISSKNVAFKIAPSINAAGRMEDDGARKSMETLLCRDVREAMPLAYELNAINKDRKTLTANHIQILNDIVSDENFPKKPIIVYQEGLHEGLVGICAGQLAEKYQVPCFVLTNGDEEGIAKGSGRSYGGIDIKEILDKHAELLHKYGGHTDAAGISIKIENIDKFREVFIEELKDVDITLDETVYYDLEINANEIPHYINQLEEFQPFGAGNPEPVFLIRNFNVTAVKETAGKDFLRLMGAPATATCFGMTQAYDDMGRPKIVDLVGKLAINAWRDRMSNQVEVEQILLPADKPAITPMAELLKQKASERYE